MARARSPNRDKAFELWNKSNGTILLKEIASQLGVTDSQIRKWKNQDKWEELIKSNVTKSKGNVTNKKGAPKGNKNAQGNGAPKGNSNAATHGFFSKYLPQESLDILKEIQQRSPVDMIWDQIMIQYTAIIRAQKIMFVEDRDDITRVLKKEKPGMFGDEHEWEFQFAWDKQASFLNAQSRAMSELRGLIKQFDDMAHINDERRLKLEGMRLNVEKTKAEIENISNDEDDTSFEIVIKRKGDSS